MGEDLKTRKINIYDGSGKMIQINGTAIEVDSVIAASGFTPAFDDIFRAYKKDGERFRPEK